MYSHAMRSSTTTRTASGRTRHFVPKTFENKKCHFRICFRTRMTSSNNIFVNSKKNFCILNNENYSANYICNSVIEEISFEMEFLLFKMKHNQFEFIDLIRISKIKIRNETKTIRVHCSY